jgi:SAM-dependent MidA family methyltransferase
MMQEELMEVYVDYRKGFVEVYKPARQEIHDYLSELRVELPKGFCAEINLTAKEWMKDIASTLNSGFVMTIDYGDPSAELYCKERKNGTLTCYHRHRSNKNPFINIGKQDITSHVNFSALCLYGHKNGLEYCGYRNQGDFLLSLGLKDFLRKKEKIKATPRGYSPGAFVGDTLVNSMGRKFKVLIQQKALPKMQLEGLKPIC